MRRFSLLLLSVGLIAIGFLFTPRGTTAERKPFGIEKRVPWTTSNIKGTPDPAPPYRTELAFPNLKFDEPLNFGVASGSDRLWVAERHGKIYSFANDSKTSKKVLLTDLNRVIYGFCFHPKYESNGYFFVTTVPDPTKETPEGTWVSRFTVSEGSVDPKSEKVIIRWPNGGHNGGCLRFGPDGYLYIVTGDGSGIADELVTGQSVDDLLGAVLRLDVDTEKPYAVPEDNYFVGKEKGRPELFAYGLRQLWKFSFDSDKGTLWGGEIGQDIWESVHIIENGGNYGWSVNESDHPFRPERPLGPTPIRKPIVEHHHVDFRSITGGYVYHGKSHPELAGQYIYGDYDTGRIWTLSYDMENKKVLEHRELADTSLRIVEWGQDQNGELLLVDHIGGQLHKLVKSPEESNEPNDFPRYLSETGLFSDTKTLTPAPGLIPYSVNSQLWSDGAIKERFLAIPGDGQIEFNVIAYPQPAPGAPRGWRFPDGTVAVKTFFIEMEKGNPDSKKRLETRILHFEQTPGTQEVGDQVWHGYTYIWNEEQTDAVLAPKAGVDQTFEIKEGNESKTMSWHFPSRSECSLCHTTPAKYVLGLNTLQLNREHDYDGVVANQLDTWEHLGLFKEPLPGKSSELARLPDYDDPKATLEERARGYLHSNCSHCHMKWGGGNAEFQLLATLDTKDLGIIGTKPQHGQFELDQPALIVPGFPERSMIYHRMTKLGLGRMPHIASSVVDEKGIELIHAWIKQLPKDGGKKPKRANLDTPEVPQ